MLPRWTKANLVVTWRAGVRRPESSDTKQVAGRIAASASPRESVEKARTPYTTIPQFFHFFYTLGEKHFPKIRAIFLLKKTMVSRVHCKY